LIELLGPAEMMLDPSPKLQTDSSKRSDLTEKKWYLTRAYGIVGLVTTQTFLIQAYLDEVVGSFNCIIPVQMAPTTQECYKQHLFWAINRAALFSVM